MFRWNLLPHLQDTTANLAAACFLPVPSLASHCPWRWRYSCEMSVYLYRTRHHIPGDSSLRSHCENRKSNKFTTVHRHFPKCLFLDSPQNTALITVWAAWSLYFLRLHKTHLLLVPFTQTWLISLLLKRSPWGKGYTADLLHHPLYSHCGSHNLYKFMPYRFLLSWINSWKTTLPLNFMISLSVVRCWVRLHTVLFQRSLLQYAFMEPNGTAEEFPISCVKSPRYFTLLLFCKND
jgi:hypothetical protein